MAEPAGFADVRAAVARRLAELRRARNLTQEEAADVTGVAWRHLQRLEAGTENPTIETLYRVVAGYGATLGDLFGEPGGEPAPPRLRREREKGE